MGRVLGGRVYNLIKTWRCSQIPGSHFNYNFLVSFKLFQEYLLLKWTYLSKVDDKVNSDVITPTLQLKFSNGANAKSCIFGVNRATTFDG